MNLLRAALLVVVTGAFLPGHAQDASAVAAAAALGTPFVYNCSWFPQPPESERLVIDLVLFRQPGDLRESPTPEELAAIAAAGGVTLHVFQLPVVRVELDTASVRGLITGPGSIATYARTPPDAEKHDIEAQVRFDRPVRESDLAALARLGVRERAYIPRPHILEVVLPDSAVPAVRRLAGVASIEPMTVVCAALAAPPSIPIGELPPPPAGWERQPADPEPRLETGFPSYAPGGEVTIMLTNTTDARIGYNLCHAELELLRGDEWVTLRPMLHPVCTDILLRLDPGAADSLTFRLAPDDPSGHYRVRAHLLNGEPKPVISNVFAMTPRGPAPPSAPATGSP
jgi:hypothetical protein